MTTVAAQLPPAVETEPDVPDVPIYRLSVEQYHQMIRAGILTENDPVELLEGWLVQKMSKNPPHNLANGLIDDALRQLLPAGWHLNNQGSLTTATSEPEPDVGVVRGDRRDYAERHPGPQDMALVIEVSDSSLRYDRGIKKRLFARAAVPVYWIVNLVDRQIEVYTEPSGPGTQPDYRQRQDFGPDDQIPVILDGREIGRLNVRDLLP